MLEPFAELYSVEVPIEGLPYVHPIDGFEYGVERLVAELPARTDGSAVRVFESRLPAIFHRLEVSGPYGDFELSTGSSSQALVAALARALSDGMLGIKSV